MRHLPWLPSSTEAAAATVERHPNYRVLRRIPPPELIPTCPAEGPTRSAVILDVETTGLDPDHHQIIELAVLPIRFDAAGRLTVVGTLRSWLEEPDTPLSPTIQRMTGLTDADLAGRRIDDTEAERLIGGAECIIAHNARFDAPFVERRLPALEGRAWACSWADLPWSEMGFEGGKLSHLLTQSGWFFEAHRAGSDVTALALLLGQAAPDGEPLLGKLVARASSPSAWVRAGQVDSCRNHLLRARGYRWCPRQRCWWREVPLEDGDHECAWLRDEARAWRPSFIEIGWNERHRPLPRRLG